MKAYIDRESCIGCGMCVAICPEVFRIAEDDLAEVYVDNVLDEFINLLEKAIEVCPVTVISSD